MKNKIIEGQLTFSFTEPNATKYDEWSFYRNQFNAVCGGTKAVDLLYLEQQNFWLIEIKDYRQHTRTKTIDLADDATIKWVVNDNAKFLESFEQTKIGEQRGSVWYVIYQVPFVQVLQSFIFKFNILILLIYIALVLIIIWLQRKLLTPL